MFSQTLGVARKYGAKVAAGGLTLAATTAVMAQEASGVADAVLIEIGKYKVDGTTIAIALVVATLTIGLIYKLARK